MNTSNRKCVCLSAIILLFMGCTISFRPQYPVEEKGSALSHLELGKRLRMERNYPAAIDEFRRATVSDPSLTEAFIRLGTALRERGASDDAYLAFERAFKLNKSNLDLQMILWDMELTRNSWTDEARANVKGKIDALLATRDQAGEIDEKFIGFIASAYHMIHTSDDISSLLDLSKYRKYIAKEKIEKVAVEDDFWKARQLAPLQKRIDALCDFVAKYPNVPEWTEAAYSWILRSYKEGELENREKLLFYCAKWIKDAAEEPQPHLAAAMLYADLGIEKEQAVKEADRALDLFLLPKNSGKYGSPGNDNEVFNFHKQLALYEGALAWALFTAGDLQRAEEILLRALRHDPASVRANYHMGKVKEKMGDLQSAIEQYIKSLQNGEAKSALSALKDIYQEDMEGMEMLRGAFLAKEEGGATLFLDVTVSAGLVDEKGVPLKYSAVAWGDYDNDKNVDLLLNGRYLYRNDGSGHFTDVSSACGLDGPGMEGGVWADYDNDGNLDFFAWTSSKEQSDRLWRNNGNGKFIDVTAKSGMLESVPLPGQSAAWGDYDNDGRVDLYVANYESQGIPRRRGTPDKLFHNNGDGTFTDCTEKAGVAVPLPKCGRSVSWGDFDNDGDLDLYVGNYRLDPNFLFVNQGNGTFVNEAARRGVEGEERWEKSDNDKFSEGYFGHTIGAAWGDYDNDGDLDLFCANLAHPRAIDYSNKSMLYRNNGEKEGYTFSNVRGESGIKYEETHSQPAWGDYDNDGFLDLAITSVYESRWSFLYRNRGDSSFSDVTWLTGTRTEGGWGCAWADYDNDGYLDLLVASGMGLRLYHNSGGTNNWLKIRLVGGDCNKSAIGARVTVRRGEKIQIREVEGGAGTASQNSLELEFGLGGDAGSVDVDIRWPCRKVQVIKNVKINRTVEVTEEKR